MRPVIRWIAGGLMIVAGLALVGHGWWSGIEEANAQRILATEVPKATPAAGTPAPQRQAPPAEPPPAPVLTPLGHWRPPGPVPAVYATLVVPAIGLRTFIVRGATLTDYYDLLAWGPAHLTGTPEPGGLGNAVLFGHVDEFGSPFRHLAQLRSGDAIDLRQGADQYDYAVRSVRLVPATDLGIVSSQPGVRALTLFTCGGPANSDRVAVYATLVAVRAPAALGTPG
jgi:LPXTG-site transpeptidase (sortase) family protein